MNKLFVQLKIRHLAVILLLSVMLVLPTGAAQAYNNIDTVVNKITGQIIWAHQAGERTRVLELFGVLFQVLSLRQDIDGNTGGENRAGVEMDNLRVQNIEADKARVRVDFNWQDASRAWLWLEYGSKEDKLQYETSRVYIKEGKRSARLWLEHLSANQEYFVRAVVENRNTGRISRSKTESFVTKERHDDMVDLRTYRARNISDSGAELRGLVDMNRQRDGRVFFVYGEDDYLVDEVDTRFERYHDIDEQGRDLKVLQVDRRLDSSRSYRRKVDDLRNNRRIYYRICVEYQNRYSDYRISCGDTNQFRTDRY